MAEEIEFGQNVSSKRARKYIGLTLYPPKQNQSITVRFVGSQQKIYQRWNRDSRSFSFSNDQKEGYSPRIVSFVLDRADEKVKAFICSSSIWNQIGQYSELHNCSQEHDFKITRQGSGLNTKYTVNGLEGAKVSQDLLDRVEITSQVYSLSDIFIHREKWELLDQEHEPIDNRFEILDL